MSEQKTLTRNMDDRIIAGVCTGLGEYFSIDPVIFRVAFVLLALGGGSGVLLYAILWIIMPEVGGETAAKTTESPAAVPTKTEPVKAAAPASAATAMSSDDDLTRIEGIGKKAASILKDAGVTSFAALAAMAPDKITTTLKDGGFGAPFNPETWPKQADLAAKGEWDALQEMQDNLKGGRA